MASHGATDEGNDTRESALAFGYGDGGDVFQEEVKEDGSG